MKIEVFGTGCRKCEQLYQEVQAAVGMSSLDIRVEKVDQIHEIAKRGIFFTPGLAMDGKVVSSGKLLKAGDILELIEESGRQLDDV